MSDTASRPEGSIVPILQAVSASGGFNRFLGAKPIVAEGGHAEIEVAVREDMTQHHGYVHGGVVGALADTVCSWAAASAVGDVVSTEYKVNFLNPAKGEFLRAKGWVVKAGKRQAVVRAEVWVEAAGAEPVLAAIALATIAATGR
jgi:uncharacterized protein (TIGR00369 family)